MSVVSGGMAGHCTVPVWLRTGRRPSMMRSQQAMNAAQVQALIRMGLPMAEDIDFRVERLDERHALARIPFHGKLVRPGGTLSGPTIMALADAAMYAVILGRLGAVEMAVTSNLNINFLSKPRPEDLLAEASILKLGRRQRGCSRRAACRRSSPAGCRCRSCPRYRRASGPGSRRHRRRSPRCLE